MLRGAYPRCAKAEFRVRSGVQPRDLGVAAGKVSRQRKCARESLLLDFFSVIANDTVGFPIQRIGLASGNTLNDQIEEDTASLRNQ